MIIIGRLLVLAFILCFIGAIWINGFYSTVFFFFSMLFFCAGLAVAIYIRNEPIYYINKTDPKVFAKIFAVSSAIVLFALYQVMFK